MNNEQYERRNQRRDAKIEKTVETSTLYLDDGSMKSPIEFREWFKILFRVWRPNLSPNEFLVAQFIFDRTAGWGKEWEVIRTSHFLHGVLGKDGHLYATGLVMTYPTLRKCLDRLVAFHAIRVERRYKQKAYALNYEWNPEEIELYQKDTVMPLATPKRLLNNEGKTPEKSENNFKNPEKSENNFNHKVKIICSYKKGKENCFAKEENTGLAPQGGILSVASHLDKTSRNTASQRQKSIQAWRGPEAARKAWQSLCEEYHPEATHLSITKNDCAILNGYGKRFMTRYDIEQWLSFLDWAVARWSVIRTVTFSWLHKNSAGVPSIRFFVKFSDHFEQAWASKKSLDRLAGLSSREREVELRVNRGVEREVAEKEVDELFGIINAKKEAEAAITKLKKKVDSINKATVDRQQAIERNQTWRKLRGVENLPPPSFDKWE
jgi:hypothetical protein